MGSKWRYFENLEPNTFPFKNSSIRAIMMIASYETGSWLLWVFHRYKWRLEIGYHAKLHCSPTESQIDFWIFHGQHALRWSIFSHVQECQYRTDWCIHFNRYLEKRREKNGKTLQSKVQVGNRRIARLPHQYGKTLRSMRQKGCAPHGCIKKVMFCLWWRPRYTATT